MTKSNLVLAAMLASLSKNAYVSGTNVVNRNKGTDDKAPEVVAEASASSGENDGGKVKGTGKKKRTG